MARKNRTKYHVRRRRFLNLDHEYPAFVIGSVEDTTGIPDDDPKRSWQWGDITLDLGDCYRRVSFDFRMGTPRERANSLHKIRLLAEVVGAVRDAIEIEAASRDARPPDKDEPD